MKKKGIPCAWWDIQAQSKGYRVYNKRTRLIVESIQISLVPQGQKAQIMNNSDPVPQDKCCSSAEKTDSSHQGLEFLFSPLLEEYYNPTHGLAEENNNDQAPNASFQEDEFINPFCTRSYFPMTRDHPLEQVRGNPTMPVQTRRQLAIDPEMCMFALTDKLHQFDRLKVWELDDKPFGKMIIEGKCYAQEEGIDFEESFGSSCSHWKKRFLRCSAGRVRDPDHPEKVIPSKKAMYGLKQALKAWYDELSNFLMSKGFTKDADHARCLDTRKSTSGGITVPWCKLVSWMSKETKLHCNVFSEAEYGGVIAAKLCSCNVDETQL
ncbi:gag-pol polyprotein [Tanacetum coccineum]